MTTSIDIVVPDLGDFENVEVIEVLVEFYNGEQFYVTNDAANNWKVIPPDVSFGDTFAMMDFIDVGTGWVLTLDQTNHRSLYRSTDGGATWIPVAP